MIRKREPESDEESRPVEEVLDAIGDPYAREVLAEVCRQPTSAKEIADALGHSRETVYRRLNLLQDHDLVSARLEIAKDGNHYQIYESAFDSVLISVEDDEYDVRIYRRDDLPDRFSDLWEELSRR